VPEYDRRVLLSPLRRAPMMLGGVGFQAGLDEIRRKQVEAQRQASLRAAEAEPDLVSQLKSLAALHDSGALSPEEFQAAKRKVLGD
jgi:Short C-terminal domain